MCHDDELLKGKFVKRVCVYDLWLILPAKYIVKCILISGNAVNNVNFLCAVNNIATLSSPYTYTIID